ncbi:MAG: hypothetical protein K0R55_685 [Sporomusa sp.]|nr:hypothetical protein [Sporomusa sp.]
MFKKSLVYLTICTLLLAGLPMVAGAATVNTNVSVSVTAVDQVGSNGSINWDEGFVEAIGTGVPSSIAKSPAQARLMARRAAIVDAQRNLLESIEGVKVTAETTVQNFETTNDIVKTQVTGIVKGAKIVNEQQLVDGTYQITLRIGLYGKGSLSEVITDATSPTSPVPFPTPSPYYQPVVLPVYTGLVIDVAGLPLERAMSPVIFDETGRAIYGHVNINPEFAVSQGMIDYMCTPEDIRALELGQSRAGSIPVMAKAIGLRDHNVNIIISQADADKILAANAQGNFLSKAMVCVRQ